MRTVTQADVEGLDALFQGLSDDDRHHRFFSLRPPARKFLEQMTRAADEGGYRLVAVISGPEDALIAEAGYAILPDGDGEFALTVAPAWRGCRLGRYLLGAIVAAAAARGVPNLQADIMLGNSRMLALVRDRGYVTLHRDEFSDMRIAIDAAQPARPRQRAGTLASCAPMAGRQNTDRQLIPRCHRRPRRPDLRHPVPGTLSRHLCQSGPKGGPPRHERQDTMFTQLYQCHDTSGPPPGRRPPTTPAP